MEDLESEEENNQWNRSEPQIKTKQQHQAPEQETAQIQRPADEKLEF